jgi:hypothetical protein
MDLALQLNSIQPARILPNVPSAECPATLECRVITIVSSVTLKIIYTLLRVRTRLDYIVPLLPPSTAKVQAMLRFDRKLIRLARNFGYCGDQSSTPG